MVSNSDPAVGAAELGIQARIRRGMRRFDAAWQAVPTPSERPIRPLLPWRQTMLLCVPLLLLSGVLACGHAALAVTAAPAALAGLLLLINWPQLGFLGFMVAVGLNWTVDSWPTSPTKGGAALCVAATALGLLLRGLRPRVHWLHCWLMAFACWSLVTALAQGNGGLSLQFSITIIGWVLVMISVHQLFVGRRGLIQISACYVLGTTAGCIMTIQAFGTTGKSTLVPVAGDANDFGMLASSAAVLGLGLARERMWVPWRVFWGVCGLTCLVVAVGSYSRGAILGLAVAIVAQLLIRPRDRKIVLSGAVLLAVGAACVYPWLQEQIAVAVQQKEFVASGNVSSRMDAWGIALHQFAQHPVTGIGLGSLQPSYFAALHLAPGALVLAFAHNTYIEILYGTGMVGAVLLGVALCWSLRAGWLAPLRPTEPGSVGTAAAGLGPEHTSGGGLSIMVLPALLCIVTACLTVTEIMYPPFWMVFLLAIAGQQARDPAVLQPRRPEPRHQRTRRVQAISA